MIVQNKKTPPSGELTKEFFAQENKKERSISRRQAILRVT